MQNHFRGKFSTIFSSFSLDYVQNFLGLFDLGIFEKRVGNNVLGRNLFKFFIGLCSNLFQVAFLSCFGLQ